ncbi:cytochrome [Sesamum angolense]|uniref:Cytochrome n=1 Tax=Sesamum angolense TaxID=2727404 RepID=A0AAE1X652_9LAMI|nr:cytochrome [Sesamum angolense]
MSIPLLIALSLIILVFLLARRRRDSPAGRKLRRPPGPPGLPFVGNLLEYKPSDLHLRLTKLSNKYGPLMSLTFVGKPLLVISSARVAKEALKYNDLAFSSRPSTIASRKVAYNNCDIAMSPYTDYWREMRKLVVLRLFTLKQVNSFRPAREEEVARMVKEISRRASAHQTVNINEIALSLSSRMISRFALGKSYDDESGPEKRRFDRILQLLQMVAVEIFFGDYSPWLGWIDRLCGKVSQLEKAFKDLDSLYEELIAEHLSPNRPESMNGDILDMLIQLREDRSSPVRIDWDHIKGVLMNMFVAGTDTTAATITWAMTALIKKPQVLNKVQQEIRSVVGQKGSVTEYDLQKLPYFKAVVKETLRFRDKDFWENPNEFLPERFLNSSVDFKGQDFGFLPFGSGRRVCPGMALGTAEVEVSLANLLYSFNWELPPGMVEDDVDMDFLPGITTHKKNALYLMAKSYL